MPLWNKKNEVRRAAPAEGASAASQDITVIGRGFAFKGDIAGQGRVRLLGRMEGRVAIQGEVSVDRSAFFQGEIQAEAVAVAGRVEGSLCATQGVALGVSAQVAGKVVTGRLAMEEGAQLNGEVRVGTSEKSN